MLGIDHLRPAEPRPLWNCAAAAPASVGADRAWQRGAAAAGWPRLA
jgi:hypothetical protein